MRIRILGGGWYGCHLASSLDDGHEVELHDIADRLFNGASGSNPARLHLGFHYPRSGATIAACLGHQVEFMDRYGFMTRAVPINIYAVADQDSLVDYQSYINTLRGRVEFVQIRPEEFGLQNVEGAVLTGERHIVIGEARAFFTDKLGDRVVLGSGCEVIDDPAWDMTVDCTFCANDDLAVDRYEPCVTAIVEGPADRAVTIMDGPFGSIYPWDERQNLSSLTNARLTPISKTGKLYREARKVLDSQTWDDLKNRGEAMMNEMIRFWPEAGERYKVVDYKMAIRAMPRSGADSRLVDVVRVGERALRVRAGKIDAVFHAERIIKEQIAASRSFVAAKMVA